MDPKMKHAMSAVMAGMGAAARDAKAKRYQKKPLEVTMGEVSLSPTHDAAREREEETGELTNPPTPGSHMADMGSGMTDDELAELGEMNLQR